MEQNPTHEEAVRRMKKRKEELIGFYIHLVVYLVINTALAIINYLTSPEHLWYYWPLLGWGVGLVIHAIFTFISTDKFFGKEWEEKTIERYKKEIEQTKKDSL